MLNVNNCKDCAYCEGHLDEKGEMVWYCGEYTGYIEEKSKITNIEDCEWAD